jgi:ribonuclease HI
MSVPAPHFHLYSEAHAALTCSAASASAQDRAAAAERAAGQWRFILRRPGGETSLEAADHEEGASEERLELLAVVRGLESLDQPSRVTLVTGRRNVQYGLEGGLAEWRQNDWQWERFGKMTPVKNRDLWQRIDRLLEIHSVDCRPRGKSAASDLAAPPPREAGFQPALQPVKNSNGRTIRIDSPTGQKSFSAPRRKTAGNALAERFGSLLGGLGRLCGVNS